MARKPETIDEYLAGVTDGKKRAALAKLRNVIKSTVPDAEECVSYGIAAFRVSGRFFVGFGASAHHCSFYPGGLPVETRKRELKAYDTSRGTIRFQPDKPLPPALVRKLVKRRLAEYARRTVRPAAGKRRSGSARRRLRKA